MLTHSDFSKKLNIDAEDIASHLMYLDYAAQQLPNFPQHLRCDYFHIRNLTSFAQIVQNRMANAEIKGFVYANPNALYSNPLTQKSAVKVEESIRLEMHKRGMR